MAVWQQFKQLLRSIIDGGIRVFSPTKDDYPKSGVQPFEGEPYDESRE